MLQPACSSYNLVSKLHIGIASLCFPSLLARQKRNVLWTLFCKFEYVRFEVLDHTRDKSTFASLSESWRMNPPLRRRTASRTSFPLFWSASLLYLTNSAFSFSYFFTLAFKGFVLFTTRHSTTFLPRYFSR